MEFLVGKILGPWELGGSKGLVEGREVDESRVCGDYEAVAGPFVGFGCWERHVGTVRVMHCLETSLMIAKIGMLL